MAAPFRIAVHPNQVKLGPLPVPATYNERLMRLIPAEVLALYLAGKAAIELFYQSGTTTTPGPNAPASPPFTGMWVAWTLICLAFVFLSRTRGTEDKSIAVPIEWPAVFLAVGSFLVWVYSLGDAFDVLHVWNTLVAVLLVLVWTYAVPYYYNPRPPKSGSSSSTTPPTS